MRIRSAASLALVSLLAVTCDKVTPVAPAGTTITLSANPTEIDVDGESTLTAIVRKEDGSPVNPGTEVTFSTTEGKIDPEVAATDERGTARSILSGLGRIGLAEVTATSGAAGDVTVEVQIGRPPAILELSVAPVALPRDLPPGGVTVDLLAVVFDEATRRQADISVFFESEIGSIAASSTNSDGKQCGRAAITDENGEACAELVVTESDYLALEDTFFLVSASAPSDLGEELVAETEIDITGVPSRIVLQPSPTTVNDAGDEVDLIALVEDQLGDPIEGAGVNFRTDLGTLASGGANVDTAADGRAIDRLSVTQEDLVSLPASARSFMVSAETVGIAGNVLTSEFSLGITGDLPRAAFSFRGGGGNIVIFTNESTGAQPLTYLWNFGDGRTSTEQNPTHDFTGGTPAPPNTYTVTLTASNSFGSDPVSQQVSVPIPP